MKKINKSDLSLGKQTITNLSSSRDGSPQTRQVTNCYDCITIHTCQTHCQQLTCPGHSEDANENCNATSATQCLCISENLQCETRTCNPSKTVGPVCCPLPPESQQGGACQLTTECQNTDYFCEQISDGCQLSNECLPVQTRGINLDLSVCDCE